MKKAYSSIRRELDERGFSRYMDTRKFFLAAIMLIPAFFLTSYFIAFTLMIATVIVSLLVSRYNLNRFGIELATFSTVTMATVFDPVASAVLGGIYIVLQLFSGSTPGVYMIWVLPSYITAGYITSGLSMDIVTLGIYTSITLQLFFTTMTAITSRSRLPKFIQYIAFNITLNIILFQTLATPLINFAT